MSLSEQKDLLCETLTPKCVVALRSDYSETVLCFGLDTLHFLFTVMLEGFAEVLPVDTLKAAIRLGFQESVRIAQTIQELSNEHGKEKRPPPEKVQSTSADIRSSLDR